MKLGTESRNKTIVAGVLGAVAVLIVVLQLLPSSPSASVASAPVSGGALSSATPGAKARPTARKTSGGAAKRERIPPSLDPTLNLRQLEATEQIKYEGSGRNIFVSQAEVVIPTPVATGATGPNGTAAHTWTPPPVTPPPPIPLKFFGFASRPGEPKKIFLSKGDDVFIAGEGEIVDRRYKVIRISPGSVEIQDVVGSGPPQSVPLTQG